MTDLTFNSVTVPLSAQGLRDVEIEIAERARSLSGSFLGTRLESGVKRGWSGQLVTADAQLAWALRKMLSGEGYGFAFASDLRDDWKGNAGWSATYATREAGGVYSDGQMSVSATNTTTWSFPTGWPTTRWTLSVWRKNGGTWEHWVKIYGTTTVWKDGVAGEALPAWLTFNGTGITLAGDAGAAAKYSEMVIQPFKWLAAWPALVFARSFALKKPPFLGVGGSLTGAGEAPSAGAEYTVIGQTSGSALKNRGSSAPLEQIDFTLEQQ